MSTKKRLSDCLQYWLMVVGMSMETNCVFSLVPSSSQESVMAFFDVDAK